VLNKIRNIGKQTAVYGFGSILNKMLGFILIPLYQKCIPIGEFGYLAVLETTIIFLVPLLNFGISNANQRFFYKEKENNTYGIYLFNNFLAVLVLSVITISIVIIFSNPVSSIIIGDSSQSFNFSLSMWIIITEILFIIPLQILQYSEKPFQYLFYNALKLVLSFGLTIFFVQHCNMGIEGILWARLAGGGITLLLSCIIVVFPQFTYKIDINSVKKSILFGFPMTVSNIGYSIFMISDRYMLNWLSNPEETGKYMFGLKIANFISLIFVQTIGMSYFPSVMSNESKEDNVRYYRKMLTYYCFFIGFIIIGFLFFYKDILWIVVTNKNYWEGLKVVPLLSFCAMVSGMNYFVSIGLFLSNKTTRYLFPSLAALVINIGLNFILIPAYGMIGAGISVLCGQVVYIALINLYASKLYKIGFEWGKIGLIYLLSVGLVVINHYLPFENIIIVYTIRLAMLFGFIVLLYKLNFFEQIEIQRIKEGIGKLRKRFLK
jgi:O-antigen/teichoic acid export membrane protein